jgi:WXG100 family type VII secretion target
LAREVVAMAAGEKFQIDLEALVSSAAHVDGQGEDLATAHLSSDNRIAAAQSGWVGASAAALHSRTATWLETSRRLLTLVGDHALDLNNDGIDFAALEHENVEKLRAARPAAGATEGS